MPLDMSMILWVDILNCGQFIRNHDITVDTWQTQILTKCLLTKVNSVTNRDIINLHNILNYNSNNNLKYNDIDNKYTNILHVIVIIHTDTTVRILIRPRAKRCSRRPKLIVMKNSKLNTLQELISEYRLLP